MTRLVFSVFLLALAIPLCAFDFSLWKAEHLSSAKFENNVLHLTKSNKAKNKIEQTNNIKNIIIVASLSLNFCIS